MPNLHRKIQNRSKKGLLYWKTGRILQKLNGTLGKTPKLKWKIQNSSKKTQKLRQKTQGFSKSTWSTCWKLIQKKAGLTPRLVVWKTWFYLFSIFERCSYFFQDKEANYFVNQLLIQAFFHRFCGFKNNRISETLSLGEKSLSLAKNPFILMGEIWNFPWV